MHSWRSNTSSPTPGLRCTCSVNLMQFRLLLSEATFAAADQAARLRTAYLAEVVK